MLCVAFLPYVQAIREIPDSEIDLWAGLPFITYLYTSRVVSRQLQDLRVMMMMVNEHDNLVQFIVALKLSNPRYILPNITVQLGWHLILKSRKNIKKNTDFW